MIPADRDRPGTAEDPRPGRRPPVSGTSLLERARRAYREFLLVPTGVSAASVLLAAGAVWADRTDPSPLAGLRELLASSVFAGGPDAAELLGLMTAGLVSLTSITFSMLLLALQQSSSTIGAQVVNSFMLRRRNQVLLGLILGMTIAVVVMRAFVTDRTVLGAALAVVFMVVALYTLAALLYAAVNQTRPQAVMQEVRTLTLEARRAQAELLRRTLREPSYEGGVERVLRCERHGYLRDVRLDVLLQALEERQGEAEIELRVEVGDYTAYGEELARIRAEREDEAERLAAATRDALVLDRQRATSLDPAFGVEQIQTSGWSSGSTAHQNPGIALEAVRNLRDIIVIWAIEAQREDRDPAPIVYPDGLVQQALDAVESIGAVSTESLQATTMEEVFRAYRNVYGPLPSELRRSVEASAERLLTGLGDLMPTRPLDEEIRRLVSVLEREGAVDTARRLDDARARMEALTGTLQGRASRAQESHTEDVGASA